MRDIFRRQRIEFGFAGEGVQMVALSLFILLLAFFIMMNGISGFAQHKVEEALSSVQEAFGASIVTINTGPSLTPSVQHRQGSGTSTLQDETARFAHEVPGLKPVYVQRSGVMQITLSISEFNRLLGLTGARQVNPELQNFINFIVGRSPVRYDVFLLLNHRSALFEREPYVPAITDAYLLMWVQALQKLGFPENRLAYGVAPGPAGTITLMVRPPELMPPPSSVKPSGLAIDPFAPTTAAPTSSPAPAEQPENAGQGAAP